MIFQEEPGSAQRLTVWADVVSRPDHAVNVIPFQVNGGLIFRDLIPQRDEDATILGVGYGEFSDDGARTVVGSGGGDPSYETVIEAGYRVQLNKFSYVMPEV